jgi:hypothetical protein
MIDLRRYTLAAIVIVAVLAGCGGSESSIGARDRIQQTSAMAIHTERGRSWMRPRDSTGDLLYAFSRSGNIYILTYPGGDPIAEIHISNSTIFGICSNSDGDVFVVAEGATTTTIYEYAHGGTDPIATFDDPGGGIACSVDPTSGNLAVLNWEDPPSGNPGVAIFENASGNPVIYADAYLEDMEAGVYDGEGDLIAGGFADNVYTFTILPHGGSGFSPFTVNEQIVPCACTNDIQWDGKYLAVTYASSSRHVYLYQILVSGFNGTVAGRGLFRGPGVSPNSWIQGDTIMLPAHHRKTVAFWQYPKGRRLDRLINPHAKEIYGTTVSVAPH